MIRSEDVWLGRRVWIPGVNFYTKENQPSGGRITNWDGRVLIVSQQHGWHEMRLYEDVFLTEEEAKNRLDGIKDQARECSMMAERAGKAVENRPGPRWFQPMSEEFVIWLRGVAASPVVGPKPPSGPGELEKSVGGEALVGPTVCGPSPLRTMWRHLEWLDAIDKASWRGLRTGGKDDGQ